MEKYNNKINLLQFIIKIYIKLKKYIKTIHFKITRNISDA